MKIRVVVLGAGFAGLELTTMLSEAIPDQLDLTLIDKSDSFHFGFSKLDVMFGLETPEAVHFPYKAINKPGVRFRQETITSIDPKKRVVATNRGTDESDMLVVALGADYDLKATPGLIEGGNEFYSFGGAEQLRKKLSTFTKGNAIVGVTSTPFKCPPAPSEAALMLHEYLKQHGTRDAVQITLIHPFGAPIPPSPSASRVLVRAFAERGIKFMPNQIVQALDPKRKVAVLDDDSEMPYDLFLGVPKHRVPDVVAKSGMTEHGWIPVDPETLETRYPGVYAVGDVTNVPAPKAGMFAEGAARVVGESLIRQVKGGEKPQPYSGAGSCYVEFGEEKVGRVDVDFFSGPTVKGEYLGASIDLAREKKDLAAARIKRWFGT